MKDFLQKLIAKRKAELKTKEERMKASTDVNEVREIGETLIALRDEINDAEAKLADLEKEPTPAPADEAAPTEEGRGLNPMATFNMSKADVATKRSEDPLSTMEYRSAFKDYVQRGVKSDVLTRADAENVSADLGVLLPNTIVNEIIKGVEKVYGQLYSRVKKTNLKGGVQYPLGSFSANLVWSGTAGTDTEHGVSEKQSAGSVTGFVQFSYYIGEIRIAQSLLESIVSVETFETEIVNALVQAYVKALDIAILSGTGTNQPTGILTNVAAGLQRIAASNIIEFTAAEIADWTSWQTKLFAKIPLSIRKERPEFALTANTFEANIETLKDANNQPVAREIYNPVTGDETAKFKGREVVFVDEGDAIKNFNDAADGEYFGIYWVPEKAYAINSNLQFGYKKYFDENTNQWITKALVIVDGKILDPKYIYLLKKKVSV